MQTADILYVEWQPAIKVYWQTGCYVEQKSAALLPDFYRHLLHYKPLWVAWLQIFSSDRGQPWSLSATVVPIFSTSAFPWMRHLNFRPRMRQFVRDCSVMHRCPQCPRYAGLTRPSEEVGRPDDHQSLEPGD